MDSTRLVLIAGKHDPHPPHFFCNSHNFQFYLVSTIVSPTLPFWCKFLQVNSIVYRGIHLRWGFWRKVENWSTSLKNLRISKWNCERDLASNFFPPASFDETMCNCWCQWFYFYGVLLWVATMIPRKSVLWLVSSNSLGIMLLAVVEWILRVGMCLCEMFLGAPVFVGLCRAVDCTSCPTTRFIVGSSRVCRTSSTASSVRVIGKTWHQNLGVRCYRPFQLSRPLCTILPHVRRTWRVRIRKLCANISVRLTVNKANQSQPVATYLDSCDPMLISLFWLSFHHTHVLRSIN